MVERHKIITTTTNPQSPAQVGNGEFAFGVDITGLQTFVPFNTMSQWSWHSFPLPKGLRVEDYNGVLWNTHGKMVRYETPDKEQPELSSWLAGNPHRFNLGRIGFRILKSDGTKALPQDIQNTRQEVDLWSGIISSSFTLEGKEVTVQTACHPDCDAIGVTVKSELLKTGQLSVFLDFPYADKRSYCDYVGDYQNTQAHTSLIDSHHKGSVVIARNMDDTKYFASLRWTTPAQFTNSPAESPHLFYLKPSETNQLSFVCAFSQEKIKGLLPDSRQVFAASKKAWPEFWKSGAAIDLSQSKDPRWKELERRIVLSQYVMRVNEAGSLPPQESGLVNNGWYGRFHFEMIWWHGVHYGLWNRWSLFEKSLHVFPDFLPGAKTRAQWQGCEGARWPKCTANFNREWPDQTHGTLIWHQPHPIYYAEMDYRMHPTKETLEKWKEIVFDTADYMADYAFFDETKNSYVLGPPVTIVSENTNPETTTNPAFELGYWRYGLRTAQEWRKRLHLKPNEKWTTVLNKLSPLPVEDGVYITHEGMNNLWEKFTFEHPALIGTYGMLPGDGVDREIFTRTLNKVVEKWDFNRTWGWDFPMIAMAAARSGNPELAIDMLLHKSKGFQFDEHGLATGGPFPYFPSNGALLTAIAMMANGWDGSVGDAPGFPKDGNWVVKAENFVKMQ